MFVTPSTDAPMARPPSESAQSFTLTIPPDPSWVRMCRETVRAAAALPLHSPQPEPAELTYLAVLLTSEAVTNAVTACRKADCKQPVQLHGQWFTKPGGNAPALSIRVRDAAPGHPSPHRNSSYAEAGRGLCLIADCASAWGLVPHTNGPGKSVWFRVGP